MLHSTLDEDRWSKSRSVRCAPGKCPASTVQKAGWDLGPIWKGAGKFARPGFRSPNSPDCCETLYRLRHPSPPITVTRMLCLASWIGKNRLRIVEFKIKCQLPARERHLDCLVKRSLDVIGISCSLFSNFSLSK